MFKLAHISDVHLGPLPDPTISELMTKRITGYLNWKRSRQGANSSKVLERLVSHLKENHPDHIVVTGDLVNLSLDREFENAFRFLEGLGTPEDITVICGNHDAYVPGALAKALNHWKQYVSPDPDGTLSADDFPLVRKIGDIAIISCNSAEATLPFMATGYFREAQAARLKNLLLETKKMCRVVIIHHPPIPGSTQGYKRLIGAELFQNVVCEVGAELVLHGHTHLATRDRMVCPSGAIPVICVPAASNAPGAHKPAGRYNLFSIELRKGKWSISMQEYGFENDLDEIRLIGTHQLS